MNENQDTRLRAAAASHQAGFSLIELLIAVTVMVIVLAAVCASLKDSFRVSVTSYELTDAQQSLRAAHEYINRDLITAGDGLNGINNIRVPVQFMRAYLTQSPVLDANDPDYMDLSLIVSDDNVPGGTPVLGTNPPATVLGGTDRITILETDRTFAAISLPAGAINATGSNVSISPADINLFRIGEIYFIASGAKATLGVLTDFGGTNTAPTLVFAQGDGYGLNHEGAGGLINFVSEGGTLPATLMRVNLAHYFVTSDGLFVRRLFGVAGAGFKDTVIAEHLADLQLRYSLNLRDNKDNMQQPVSKLETTVQQTATRQVEISIKARTAHPLNDGQPKYLSMTTATSIRNMQFRLAQ
jgi:prepilin-type N-terminal cleavage/methylation domain-containing protein